MTGRRCKRTANCATPLQTKACPPAARNGRRIPKVVYPTMLLFLFRCWPRHSPPRTCRLGPTCARPRRASRRPRGVSLARTASRPPPRRAARRAPRTAPLSFPRARSSIPEAHRPRASTDLGVPRLPARGGGPQMRGSARSQLLTAATRSRRRRARWFSTRTATPRASYAWTRPSRSSRSARRTCWCASRLRPSIPPTLTSWRGRTPCARNRFPPWGAARAWARSCGSARASTNGAWRAGTMKTRSRMKTREGTSPRRLSPTSPAWERGASSRCSPRRRCGASPRASPTSSRRRCA